MSPQRSSAIDFGRALVGALAERDFGRLAEAFAPDVRMRALIPPGPVELLGVESAAERFATWFGDWDALQLVQSGIDEIGDRLHVFYRLRVWRSGEGWKIIEQHVFCALAGGRIGALDLVCSGFRTDEAGASSSSAARLRHTNSARKPHSTSETPTS